MAGSGPDQRAWAVEELGAVAEGDPGLALPVQGVDLGGFPVQHGAQDPMVVGETAVVEGDVRHGAPPGM